jgi:plastocyanin
MTRARLMGLSGVAVLLACSSGSNLTSPGGSQPALPNGSADVTIQDFSFSPSSVTIKAGATVRWTNHGPSAHTTTSDAGLWDSGQLTPPSGGGTYGGGGSAGGSFRMTFTTAGTYGYHCTNHPPSLYPNFIATVTVTP